MKPTTRFMVLPDGTCAPLSGCMIIDVPDDLPEGNDSADEWIAENADNGYSLMPRTEHASYYDLVNALLIDLSDEQLMQTPTIHIPGINDYYAVVLAVTDEKNCWELDHNHVVFTIPKPEGDN